MPGLEMSLERADAMSFRGCSEKDSNTKTHSARTEGNTTITSCPRSHASKSLPATAACFSLSCTKWRTIRFVSMILRLLSGRLLGCGQLLWQPGEFQRRTFPYPSCWQVHLLATACPDERGRGRDLPPVHTPACRPP